MNQNSEDFFYKMMLKALGRGGVIIRPLFSAGRARSDPTFQSIEENVFCKISATTMPNLDFNGAFEPRDPWLSFPGSERRIE